MFRGETFLLVHRRHKKVQLDPKLRKVPGEGCAHVLCRESHGQEGTGGL